MVLGLVASIVLAQGSLIKALGMVVLGLLLGLVGTDVTSGTARFAFGLPELADGINFVVVAMGVFGVAEIARNLENERTRQVHVAGIGRLLPSREDMGRMRRADPARHRRSARCSASCPAAGRCSPRLPPTRWRRKSPPTGPSSGRAPSKAWRRRRRPTTPARRPPSFRC